MQQEAGASAEASNPYTNPTQAVGDVNDQAHQSEQQAAVSAILKAQVTRGANWFYWIAGLSMVNLFAIVGNTDFRFVFGLGISEGLAEWAKEQAATGAGSGVVAIAAAGSIGMTAFFALCGKFANRPSAAAFIVGMIVFVLDSLVFVLIKDWIAVAFHAYATYALWRGFSAARQYKALNG